MEGSFPGDKETMLSVMDRYLALPDKERLLFRFGRRGGAIHSLDDLTDPLVRARLERACHDLRVEAGGDIEALIIELGDRYIYKCKLRIMNYEWRS